MRLIRFAGAAVFSFLAGVVQADLSDVTHDIAPSRTGERRGRLVIMAADTTSKFIQGIPGGEPVPVTVMGAATTEATSTTTLSGSVMTLLAGSASIGSVGLDAGVNSIGTVGLDAGVNSIGTVGLDAGTNTIGFVLMAQGPALSVTVLSGSTIGLEAGSNSVGTFGLDTGVNSVGTVGLDAGVNSIGTVGLDAGTNTIGFVLMAQGPALSVTVLSGSTIGLEAGSNSVGTFGLDAGVNSVGTVGLDAGTNIIGFVKMAQGPAISVTLLSGATVGLDAGVNSIGSVGIDSGQSVSLDHTVTVTGKVDTQEVPNLKLLEYSFTPLTALYQNGDQLGPIQELLLAARVSGGGFMIQSVQFTDSEGNNPDVTLVYSDQTFTTTGDGAAFDPDDTEVQQLIGHIKFVGSDWEAYANNGQASKGLLGQLATVDATSVFVTLVIKENTTWAAGQTFKVRIYVIQE